MADHPVGKAQQAVLDALGLHAGTFAAAEERFEEIGIIVRAVRVGRTSEPRVRFARPAGGEWNEGGDGDGWPADHQLTPEQIASLKEHGWWEG